MFFQSLKTNQASALVISLLVLSVLLAGGMLVFDVIIKDLVANRKFGESNYAYYAADVGLKKTIFLLNNKIYNNGTDWGSFYLSDIDMCPTDWDELANECPCPIMPSDPPACAVSSSLDPILIMEGNINSAHYQVYLKIVYNDTTNPFGLDRTIYLISIGSYGDAQRKLEYQTCIGNFCGR